jgi:ATP-dependent DNA ligase I
VSRTPVGPGGQPVSEPSGRIGIVLLSEVAATSGVVAGAAGRLDKIAAIASLLTSVPEAEVPVAVAFLSGELTQRQIGVGYAALVDLLDPADFEPPPESHAGPESQAGSEPVLTLTETDAMLGRIGALLGPGSQAQRRDLLADLLRRATGAERRFLVRLLAGDLRQGALEGVMTEAVARAAGVPAAEVRRAHQLRGSLPEVARAALAAAGGGDRADVVRVLRGFTLRIGRPVRPMLAASAPTVDAALARLSPAALEWKIDGVRIQIHRDGRQVRVFTRTLEEITDRVPELVRIGLELDARTAVVDGEAVALRPGGRPYPFQVTSARVATQRANRPGSGPTPEAETRRRPGAVQVALTAFLFDLLHADGEDLLDRPASERVRRLAAIAPAGALVPRLVTADTAEAARFFGEALARGHEGVVVKSVDAPYRAGRRGADWIKVKPQSTLDLVILAAEWGHGRRTGLLSNLHLGARDPATGGFVMLGKTFKGLTDATLVWQTSELLARADPPAAAGHGPPRGVVRVRPELVAEIAFDGVQASRRYPGGVTLRFARVLRYRTDKDAAEADTIDSVRALWAGEPDQAPASGA